MFINVCVMYILCVTCLIRLVTMSSNKFTPENSFSFFIDVALCADIWFSATLCVIRNIQEYSKVAIPNLTVTVGDTEISSSDEAKNLGVIVD